MFEHLNGELARKSPTEAVVDANGVGYRLSISLHCYAALPASGRVKLLVHVHHNADSGTRLYGFLDEDERAFFQLLQKVGGVGPAVALSMLSYEKPGQLARRLKSGDVEGLKKIRGVGKKTAERLVVELKDKVAPSADALRSDHEEQLVKALESLGLDEDEAGARARAATKAMPDEERVEELLRHVLKARAAGGR